jgi:hypothetical protein
LRALRWRRGASIALLVVAAFAVGASAVSPMFLAAADDSVLTSVLAHARPGAATVTFVATGSSGALAALHAAADPRFGEPQVYAAPVVAVEGEVELDSPGGTYVAGLFNRSGICGVVKFVSGSCPRGQGEVAISSRSAHASFGAIALGGAGLIALSVGGSLSGAHPDPVAAFAPALLALAAGVLAVRLVALAIRALLPATRDTRLLATFLALRELARRRPSALRRLLPLIAAIAVAVFSVAAG